MATTDAAAIRGLKETARFDFERAAADAYAEFPGLRRVLAFYNRDNKTLLQGGGFFENIFSKIFVEKSGQRLPAMEYLKNNTEGPAILPLGTKREDPKILLHVSGYLDNHAPFFFPGTSAMHDSLAFYHELGHALLNDSFEHEKIPGTEIVRAKFENEADAFGEIRVLQKFGEEARQMLDHWSMGRAFDAIDYDDMVHLTTFTVDKILLDASSAKFLSLTSVETSAIAKQYAKDFTPPDEDAVQIFRAFSPLEGKLRGISPENTEPLKDLAETITRKDANPYAVYMGARILKEFLKPGGMAFAGGGSTSTIELTGDYWDGMKEKISEALSGIPSRHRLQQLQLNKLDITGRVRPPEEVPVLAPFARQNFNASAAGRPVDFAVSSIDMGDTPEIGSSLMLAPVSEVLSILAAPGFAARDLDILVTDSWRRKADEAAKDDPAYRAPFAILTGKWDLGLSMHMVSAADSAGLETTLCVIEDLRRKTCLVVGDKALPPEDTAEFKKNGVFYIARSSGTAAGDINGFLAGTTAAAAAQGRNPAGLVEGLIRAFSCLCKVPKKFLTAGHAVPKGTTFGDILAEPTDRPTIYTSIMKPKPPAA